MDREEWKRHEADVAGHLRSALRSAVILHPSNTDYAIEFVEGVLDDRARELLDDALASLRADGLLS